MKKFCLFLLLLIQSWNAAGQDANSLYRNALNLYHSKELFKANAEFKKVLVVDPDHRDALFNLAMINQDLKDDPQAIMYLLKCVKLGDKEAARMLKNKFKYKLTYGDTMQNIPQGTRKKYNAIKQEKFASLNNLSTRIISLSADKREQLQLLLLWTSDHFAADSARFFNGGPGLSVNEAFAKRIGLCEEFSNILKAFCDAAKIQNLNITGYVKYPEFKKGDIFREANHGWNVIRIDSTWFLCDLFWSISALQPNADGQYRFVNELETNYFLAIPSEFILTHLPSDPVFQFDEHPIAIESFEGENSASPNRMPYLNFTDSLKVLLKMTSIDRGLRMASHSYTYNKENPNEMIIENYNFTSIILNKSMPSKAELKKARSSLLIILAVIDKSTNEGIRSVKGDCNKKLADIDKRLLTVK